MWCLRWRSPFFCRARRLNISIFFSQTRRSYHLIVRNYFLQPNLSLFTDSSFRKEYVFNTEVRHFQAFVFRRTLTAVMLSGTSTAHLHTIHTDKFLLIGVIYTVCHLVAIFMLAVYTQVPIYICLKSKIRQVDNTDQNLQMIYSRGVDLMQAIVYISSFNTIQITRVSFRENKTSKLKLACAFVAFRPNLTAPPTILQMCTYRWAGIGQTYLSSFRVWRFESGKMMRRTR